MIKATIYLQCSRTKEYVETETLPYERARLRLAFWESQGRPAYAILEPSTLQQSKSLS